MAARKPDFYHPRYSAYVPALQYADDVVHSAPLEVDFGTPVAGSATGIASAIDIAVAGEAAPTVAQVAAPFGRNLTVVASGAATSTVTVHGNDYLGQRVSETLTLNGTTPVVGLKAFKYISRIAYGATASRTINVGTGAALGLPYRTATVLAEKLNSAAGTVGTLAAAVLTDPATAITGDPRGTYTPNATVNGTNRIAITALVDNFVNPAGNGGLHGVPHFSS